MKKKTEKEIDEQIDDWTYEASSYFYRFSFALQPVALKRHRHGGHRTWNPQRAQMDEFARQFKEQADFKDISIFEDCPLEIRCEFYIEMPKSWSEKKKKSMERRPHTQTPDLSNLIKFVEDSLNGVAYSDDKQIVFITAFKQWAREPKIEVIFSLA